MRFFVYHKTMSFGDRQVYRKRKVPESRTCNTSDSDSDDPDGGDSSEDRKVARLASFHWSEALKEEDIPQGSSSVKTDSSDSDSEKNDSEKCPICLKTFKSQTLGITDSCNYHLFCLSCLEEWSKNKDTCPVDRKQYKSILVLDKDGKVAKEIPVKIEKTSAWPPGHQQPTFCEICGLYNNEERMLLCDGCDMRFHMYCLIPQLDRVPTGTWLCNECWYYYNY